MCCNNSWTIIAFHYYYYCKWRKTRKKRIHEFFKTRHFFFSLSSGIHMKNYAGSCLMRYSLWGSLFIFYELNFLFIYITHIHTNKVLKWKGFKQLDHIRYFFQRFFSIQPSTVQHRTYIRMRIHTTVSFYTAIGIQLFQCSMLNVWLTLEIVCTCAVGLTCSSRIKSS